MPVNDVIFNTFYYGHPVNGPEYPWCVAFLWSVFALADAGYLFFGGNKTAYAPTLASWYIEHGQWSKTPKRGDIVFFDHQGDQIADHAGLVVEVSSDTIRTIEGNTTAGTVAYRMHKASDAMGYAHPAYSDTFRPYAARVRVSDYLNVRTGPGVNYPILQFWGNELFRLPDGMEIAIIEENGSWGRISNISGWISLHYVRKVGT